MRDVSAGKLKRNWGTRHHVRRRGGYAHGLVAWAGALLALGSCSDAEETKTCSVNWDDSMLLLDCLDVGDFPLDVEVDPLGRPVVPARLRWTAPRKADVVVCGLFAEVPTFAASGIARFEESVAFYSVRKLQPEESTGVFDLATAREGGAPCPWKVFGAACFAYSLTEIVGTTALREVDPTGLFSACPEEECVARPRRLGRMEEGRCLAFCTSDLAAQCVSCDGGGTLCRDPARADGGLDAP